MTDGPTTTVTTFMRGVQHISCPQCDWNTTTYYDRTDKAIDVAYAHDRKHAREDSGPDEDHLASEDADLRLKTIKEES